MPTVSVHSYGIPYIGALPAHQSTPPMLNFKIRCSTQGPRRDGDGGSHVSECNAPTTPCRSRIDHTTKISINTSVKCQITTAQMKVMLHCTANAGGGIAALLASGCRRGGCRRGRRWRNRIVVLAGEPVGRDRQVQVVLAGERIHVEVGATVSRRQRHIDLAVLLETIGRCTCSACGGMSHTMTSHG